MGYIIYDKKSTRIVGKTYKTHAAAQAQLTRMRKAAAGEWGVLTADADPLFLYGIAEAEYYARHIERMVTRVNLMTGAEYTESINTPIYMSPASETYWSQ
jgi:hypothetical protein